MLRRAGESSQQCPRMSGLCRASRDPVALGALNLAGLFEAQGRNQLGCCHSCLAALGLAPGTFKGLYSLQNEDSEDDREV